jgi:CSLREA domain-containing protein
MLFRTIALVVIVWAGVSLASAASFTVNTTTDSHDVSPGNGVCADSAGRCSLRGAIDEANALAGADVIYLPAGQYTTVALPDNGQINGKKRLETTGSLTINGVGSGSTFIQGATAYGGSASTQEILRVHYGATLNVSNVTFRYGTKYLPVNSLDTSGTGLYVDFTASLTLDHCVVRDNLMQSNAGPNWGGGIYNSGTLRLDYTTVTNNKIQILGGGEAFGAGIMSWQPGTVTLNNSSVTNNQIVSSANAQSYGAGICIYLANSLTANNSVISGNSASLGTGVNSRIRGVGISIVGSSTTVNLANTTVSNNTTSNGQSNQGAGIYFESIGGTSTITIDRSTVSGNQLSSGNAYGGGMFLYANGAVLNQTMTNSTVSGNFSAGYAGGIFINNNQPYSVAGTGTFNYTNDTISSNFAYQDGGGIYFYRWTPATPFQLNLNFVTVAVNVSNYDAQGTNGGGGIFAIGDQVNLKNSVIANNYAAASFGQDLRGNFYSQGYNHIGVVDSFTLYGSNATDGWGTPNLGPLQNNYGPTFTHLPNFGPLIDKIPYGVNGCGTSIATDQRGYPRPAYNNCDKGAVEWWYAN